MIKRSVFLVLFIFFFLYKPEAQCPSGGAIFVNEIYNAAGNSTEYIELVVVGDPTSPTSPVDLSGWIVDDNNINQSGQGNATGHLILNNTFNNINPGAIILIYNEHFPYGGLPANNPPWLYVVSGADIDGCSSSPSTSNSNFTPCGTAGGDYNYVLMANGGDIVQTRDNSEIFYHALRYSSPNVASDVFPTDVADKTIGLDCGDWFDGSNYTITSQTPGEANSPDNLLLINSIRNGTIDCNNINFSCLAPCPEINGLIINPIEICQYDGFDVTATGLANMNQSDNQDKDFGIEFVYFPGSVPPADAYSGGTTIGDVPNSSLTGVNPNQEANLTISSGVIPSGIYNICAILDQPSINDCNPQQCSTIEIFQPPTAELSGTFEFCPGDCYSINTIISGGTEPYEAFFTISVGAFNVPFNIPSYDINNQLIICYSGTFAPSYNSGNNTLYIPTSMFGVPFTGIGTLTLTGLIDDNGCEAQTINPDNTTLIFKENLDISTAGPIEECDYDNDGQASFDLTQLDITITGGSSTVSTNWFEDSDCNISIVNPSSFSTASTTVYVFLTDNANEKCNSDTIPIDLIVIDIPFPGENNDIEICNTETCLNLHDNLYGFADYGGDWNDDDNSGADMSNVDCVDFTSVEQGVYNFTYTIQDNDQKCDPVSAVLTIEVSVPGNPGEDNDDTFCGAPTDLINIEGYLGNDFDPNGTWSNFQGIDISDINNVDLSNEVNDTYYFYYEIDNPPCDLQEAVITIEIVEEPNAGQNNELYVCNSGVNTILNLEIALGNHDSNGDWEDDDGSGVDLSTPNYVDFVGVVIDTFHYSYIIPENGSCPEDSATITVIIEATPFAGLDGAESVCVGSTDTIDLFEYIGQNADSTGVWTQIGGQTVNINRPDTVIFTTQSVGVDSFMYVTIGSCGSDSAFVYIDITASPNAGLDYNYTVCIGETINLYDSLNNFNVGGTWIDSNMDTILNPQNVSLNELKTYSFSYIIPENGACSGDTANATIITIDAPEAGVGENFSVCQNSSNTVNLFEHITGNSLSNGYWIDHNNIVISDPKNFDFSSFNIGNYTFSYILASNGYCPGDSASLSVIVVSAPEAGTDSSFTVCNSDINNFVDFDNLLGAHDITGNWININNVGVDITNSNNVNFTDIAEGSYQFKYLINANETCPADSAIVTIDVVSKLSAGQDKELTFCEGGNTMVSLLDELKPDFSTSYIVEDINQSGALNDVSLMIDISLLSNDTYSYRLITGQDELCGMDTSYLTITIVEAYKAGEPNNLEVCNDDAEFDLDILLGVHDLGGEWIDLDNSNVDVMSSAGKQVSFKDVVKGIYRFEYKIEASGTCPESSAIITVEVNPVTYSTFTQQVCPGQIIKIGNTDYSLDNPTGEEILTNVFNCDSIVTVNLTPKLISSSYITEQENCFGFGKFVLKSMNNAVLPLTLSIENFGDYQISNFPFVIDDIPGGDYKFDLVDSEGCISDISTLFSIGYFTPFDININVNTNEDSYSLNVQTNISPFSITWSPNTWLSCNDCLNPIAKPETNQEYIVTIIDEEGCIVSDTVLLNAIEVEEDILIDIPNIFTPNGDGSNDIYYVSSENVDLIYTMYIFNRWGEKVFYKENLNFNDSKDGWDGWYKGKKLNPGVYVYMITVDFGNNKTKTFAGDLLLLK